MQTDPLSVSATPARVRRLAAYSGVNANGLGQAFVHAGITPDRTAWIRFIDRTLLWLAVVLTLSGVFFFFAYNWAEMHRFVKFGLIEVGLLVAVGCAARWGRETLIGKLALLSAAMLIGVLWAVFGQAYQTGADSFQLFLTWAILISPWVVVSQWSPLWLLLLILANTTLIFFWQQRISIDPSGLFEFLALGNAVWLGLWEATRSRRVGWGQERWLAQLVALWLIIALTTPTLQVILEDVVDQRSLFTSALYVGLGGALLLGYRHHRDLLILTMAAFSLIVVVTAAASRLFGDGFDSYIVLSALVIAQAVGAVYLLRRMQRTWEQTS